MAFSVSGDVNRDVTITFIGRDRASSAMRSISSSANSTSSRMTRLAGVMKKVAMVAATALAAAAGIAGYALFNLGKASIESASNLNESINAVKVTWGKAADDIFKQSKKAAEGLGLSQEQFNSIAVQFRGFAGTIAGKGGDVAGTLDTLVTRGADFASVMDMDVNEALRLFQSGLAGETEPLRRFNVDLSAATVGAYAVKEGIAASADSMTEAQKVQARYQLLMKQTSKTQGDFKNTSDSLANSQRRLNANWENAKARIGKALLPIMGKLVNFLNDKVVPAIRQHLVPAVKSIGKWIQNSAVPWVKKLHDRFSEPGGFYDSVKDVWEKVVDLAGALGDLVGAISGGKGAKGKGANDSTQTIADSLSNMAETAGDVVEAIQGIIDKLTALEEKTHILGQLKSTNLKESVDPSHWWDWATNAPEWFPGDADGGWLKKRAMGGRMGRLTLVGEHGPELIDGRGFVKTHSQTMGTGNAPVVINVNGAIDPVSTARQIERILAKGRRVTGAGGLATA